MTANRGFYTFFINQIHSAGSLLVQSSCHAVTGKCITAHLTVSCCATY